MLIELTKDSYKVTATVAEWNRIISELSKSIFNELYIMHIKQAIDDEFTNEKITIGEVVPLQLLIDAFASDSTFLRETM